MNLTKTTQNLSNLNSSTQQLQNDYQILQQLCNNLDPYQPIPAETIDILSTFDIRYTENPFDLTNQMLVRLLEIEEQLKIKGSK